MAAMCRSALLFLLCVVELCAAQNRGGATADGNSTTRDTCEGSTADFCVRTCCPRGQNFNHALRACETGTVNWQPSFLNDSVTLEVVERPLTECGPNEDLKVFSPYDEVRAQFELQPNGELVIRGATGLYDLGHDYCFRNIEHAGRVFESVRTCVPRVVPQVPGLVSIDNVTEVSFRKCCPFGQMLEVNKTTQDLDCVNGSVSWLPNVLHGDPTELTQLSPEKAKVEDGGDSNSRFECPRGTLPKYLFSALSEFHLLADNQLLVATYDVTIKPNRFCLDLMQRKSSKPDVVGHFCDDETEEHTKEEFEEICPGGVCVLKCCAPGFVLLDTHCVRSPEKGWQPTFHDKEQVVNAPVNHTILHGKSECDGHNLEFSRSVGEEDIPFLQANGEIYLPGISEVFAAHQCCLDHALRQDKDTTELVETAFCCQPKNWEQIIVGHVKSTLLSVSAICLFVMLAIYAMVPKLRNLHGQCLMSHAAALFIAFFLTIYDDAVGLELGPGCDSLALLLYYSFIAALFWLNVMSFDIWWTFAHLRTQAPSQRSLRNRFIRHSIYAWGVPLLMTVTLAFLNYAPEDIIPKGAILRPELGKRKCFISGQKQELYYFYLPIFIVTGVNIIFFAATAWTLYQAEKSSRILNRKRTARERLKVYVNLFIIMEVSWIAECLSTQVGPVQAWYFTDIINASQGLLIFILFIARHSTRQTIRERFAELRKRGVFHPRPVAKTDGAASQPTKTSGTTITNSSSAARKSSETEAYQMTEKKSTAETNGNGVTGTASSNGDVTADGEEPASGDCAC